MGCFVQALLQNAFMELKEAQFSIEEKASRTLMPLATERKPRRLKAAPEGSFAKAVDIVIPYCFQEQSQK